MSRSVPRERLSAAMTPPETTTEFEAPVPLAEVVESVVAPLRALRRDVRLPASSLAFEDGHLRLDRHTYALRPYAAQQLLALAGVQRRSPSWARDLRCGLRARGAVPVLARIDSGEVRAILSARFAPFDDLYVLDRVGRTIASLRSTCALRVRWLGQSDGLTVVRLTHRRSRVEVRHDDVFDSGIEISVEAGPNFTGGDKQWTGADREQPRPRPPRSRRLARDARAHGPARHARLLGDARPPSAICAARKFR